MSFAAATLLAVTLPCGLAVMLGCSPAHADTRLDRLVNLRTDRFNFDPPHTAEAWRERAAAVRRRVMVAAGLWPMPERPKIRAAVHGKIVRDGYSVEKVYFESYPGHFVTGNLYRPLNRAGPCPGVLSPHGHWGGGRFHRWDDEEHAAQVALGAEPSSDSGRYPLQARCVQLARMGCVVFIYDMLGYADSQQLSQQDVHAPTTESILNDSNGWGFFSVEAELRMQSPLGVQTYNSLCALDWLASLEDVDPARLAVTGGSSGATQTLMLCAIDDRPEVAVPVVMVSTAMQGGCPCENACCLRMGGVSNVEFAAMMAPKPLGVVSADDWTREFARDGYPQLKSLYALLDAGDHLMHASLTQYPHNYNRASRAAMYPWLARWLKLPPSTPTTEREFEPLAATQLTVWNDDHPRPPGGREHEAALMRAIDRQSQATLEDMQPSDEESLEAMRRLLSEAYCVLLDKQAITADDVSVELGPRVVSGDATTTDLVIRRKRTEVALSATLLTPLPADSVAACVLWLHPEGSSGLFGETGKPVAPIRKMLDAGVAVMGVNLIAQPASEEFTAPTTPGMRPAASLTYGYNPTIVAHRVADATAALAALKRLSPKSPIGVVGVEGAAAYTAGLAALERERINALLIQSNGFRFAQLDSWQSSDFVPGAVKYGDALGMLALYSPRPLLIVGESPSDLGVTGAAYRAADAEQRLQTFPAANGLDGAIDQLTSILTK